MATARSTTWQALGSYLGVVYFIAVTLFVCPGMQSATQRYGPHFVFDTTQGSHHQHEHHSMPHQSSAHQQQQRVVSSGSTPQRIPHRWGREHQHGPVISGLGARLPPATFVLIQALETFLMHAIHLLAAPPLLTVWDDLREQQPASV